MSKTCTTCIHRKVCAIYEYAIKWNRESAIVHFKPSRMAEVCGEYRKEKE